eukprot:TCONS_00040347-protein
MNECDICYKDSSFKCSKCKLANYCSKECQTRHWSKHKGNCVLPTTHVANLSRACILDLLPSHAVQQGYMDSNIGNVFGFKEVQPDYPNIDISLNSNAIVLFGIYQQILKYEIYAGDDPYVTSICSKLYTKKKLQKAYEQNKLDKFFHEYLDDAKEKLSRYEQPLYGHTQTFLDRKLVIGPTNKEIKLSKTEIKLQRKEIYERY